MTDQIAQLLFIIVLVVAVAAIFALDKRVAKTGHLFVSNPSPLLRLVAIGLGILVGLFGYQDLALLIVSILMILYGLGATKFLIRFQGGNATQKKQEPVNASDVPPGVRLYGFVRSWWWLLVCLALAIPVMLLIKQYADRLGLLLTVVVVGLFLALSVLGFVMTVLGGLDAVRRLRK